VSTRTPSHLLLVGALCVACSSPPDELPWKVTTPSSDIADRAAAYEAEIRRDGCAGPILHRDTFTESPSTPPVLEPGDYAFVVRVRDADCRLIGEGCTPVTLPSDAECVEVVVAPASGAACDAEATCDDGICVGPDAPPDVGLDADVPDGPRPDAPGADTITPPVDTGVPPDTSGCAPCDDGIACTRDECDGDTCVHRPDHVACDDGAACTLDECSVVSGCSNTPDHSRCDDANLCTDDRCEPMTGCVTSYNTVPCDDTEFCNGIDMCRNGTCSRHAGNPCSANCVESSDRCRSDCDLLFESWTHTRRCMGTVVSIGTTDDVYDCADYCEDISESMGMRVDCCQYRPSLRQCTAYTGDSTIYTAATGYYALRCDG
jgi:hypothetical protein